MRNNMISQISHTVTKILFLVVISLVCKFTNVSAQDGTISVIGNEKGVPITMKFTDLKNVLKGEKQRWSDGTKISIALMKSTTPEGQTSAKKIYNMSGDELNRFWLALVFQGKASAPTFFNSLSELETYVAQTPGAIGVVTRNAANDSKLITIDGKKEL